MTTYYSNSYIQTNKKTSNNVETTSELLLRAGFIRQISGGSYCLLPCGVLVYNKIKDIITKHLLNSDIGIVEVQLNQLQDISLWQQSNRADKYGKEMFTLSDRKDNIKLLAPTAEEYATVLASSCIDSYKDLPLIIYQINNKFRDELRTENGLIRTKEFSMLDVYSFDKTKDDSIFTYNVVKDLFVNIFDELLGRSNYKIVSTDVGEVGGSFSEEFIAITPEGEVEVGHCFNLEDIYTSKLHALYTSNNNTKQLMYSCCFGIGITRLIQVIASIYRKGNKLGWNNVPPFDVAYCIVDVNKEIHIDKLNNMLSNDTMLKGNKYIDLRDLKLGRKLNDLELIGVPNIIVVGDK